MCKCGCEACEMDDEFMDELQYIRELLQFPFIISSGYRCYEHNQKVSRRSMGDHTIGKAVDILIKDRYKRRALLKVIFNRNVFKDIAVDRIFIHVGMGKKDYGMGVY